MTTYTTAITRNTSPNYRKCISSHPLHNELNINKAIKQQENYKKVLRDLSLEIIEIEADKNLPDCCFIEDTAIIHNNKALLTRSRMKSRRNEITEVKTVLKEFFQVTSVTDPGTIEGGDVVHIHDQLISGLSQRTNHVGIKQAEKWFDTDIKFIPDPSIVHLKSYISQLDFNTILCTKRYANHPALREFKKIIIPESEIYAANVLEVNERIIIPSGFEKTRFLLNENGYEIIELNTSEFQKCEGALTCLSLLF